MLADTIEFAFEVTAASRTDSRMWLRLIWYNVKSLGEGSTQFSGSNNKPNQVNNHENISTFLRRIEFRNVFRHRICMFWVITLCSPLKVNRRFRRTFRLHLQVTQDTSAESRDIGCACYLLHYGTLLGLFLDPKDEGCMFFRNVGLLLTLHGVVSHEIEHYWQLFF
jgi:hypothetical protein